MQPGVLGLLAQAPATSQSARARQLVRMLLVRYRLVAFTSEVGESLRPLIQPWKVDLAYVVSWLYCIVDVVLSGIEASAAGWRTGAIARNVVHMVIFHSIATMLIPAVLIHEAVHYSAVLIRACGASGMPYAKWWPTALGLALIPAMPLFDPPVEALLDRAFGEHVDHDGGGGRAHAA